MAKSPDVGATARVSNPKGIGEGFGAVPAGTEVTVTDVHDAGTPGTGDVNDKKVVRLEFEEPGLVLGDDGNVKNGSVKRAITVSLSEYNDLFEEAGN